MLRKMEFPWPKKPRVDYVNTTFQTRTPFSHILSTAMVMGSLNYSCMSTETLPSGQHSRFFNHIYRLDQEFYDP